MAKTHTDTFVPGDLDRWPFDLKVNGFTELMVEHFYVMFGDPSFVDFWDITQKDRQTNASENPTPCDCLDVSNYQIDHDENKTAVKAILQVSLC